MRMRGLEPPRGFPHTDLNRARLPIPPHPRGGHCSRLLFRPVAVPPGTVSRLARVSILLLTAVAAVLLVGGAARGQHALGGPRVEVVVTIHGAQQPFLERLRSAVPGATVRWRYRTVLNGVAVVVP